MRNRDRSLRGSRTEVGGKCIRVGNLKYMKENGVRADGAIPDANGAIPNYVGVGDKIVAVLYAMDNPRERPPRHQRPALRRRGRH